MAANDKSLRIACRFVCRDQWLVTHVDPSWPISTLKLFLLHKFTRTASDPDYNPRAIPVSPRKARRRSLSPITFAPPPLRKAQPTYPSISATAKFSGSEDEADLDFDDDVNITKAFTDAHRYKYTARPSTSSIPESTPRPSDSKHDPNAYVLLTFSTTQILEDRFNLLWYGMHPGELLELHPTSLSFVSLPRSTLDAYIAPYFAARVWALRIVGHGSDEKEDDGTDPVKQNPRDKREKRKIAVEWKERWAIIHQGVFSLCKERHDTHVAFSSPLSSMLSIRDSAHFSLPLHTSRLRRKSSVTPTGSNVVCVKFRTSRRQGRPFSNESVTFDSCPQDRRDPSTPSLNISTTISAGTLPVSASGSSSGGQGAWWRKGSRDVSGALMTSGASGTPLVGSTSSAFVRRGSAAGLDDSEGESGARRVKGKGKERDEAENAVWIVLDMLDSSACSHILRIMHRHAPPQCHSTFLPSRGASVYSPSPSPIIFSTRSSSPGSPSTPGPPSSHTLPLSPSHNTPQPSTLLFPTPTGACSSYIPYKAYHFGGSSETRPPSPTLPPPGYSLSELVSAELGRGEGVPYPSWRLELVRKARRAGLGAVGRAMELVMFGDEDDEDDAFADDEDDEELMIEWARPKRNTMSSFSPSPVGEQPIGRSTAPWTQRYGEDTCESPIAALRDEGDGDAMDADADERLESEVEMERGGEGEGGEEGDLHHPRHNHRPHWFEDLSYLDDPEAEPTPESDGSEAEWDGWVDAVVSQYRQESLARRTQARREALAASGALDTPVSSSGTPVQVRTEEWTSRFGGESATSIAAADRERANEDEQLGTWTWPRKHSRGQYQKRMGSDADLDGSTEDSSDPSASPTPHNAYFDRDKSRGRRGHGHSHWGRAGRTLSTYSSVDSLLRRTATMRSNIKSMSLSQMKRSSLQALFPSASSSNIHLARQDVCDVPSATHANSSNPSIADTIRAAPTGSTSANTHNRPLSPLSTQVPDDVDEDRNEDEGQADVDDVDELEADGVAELYWSEIGHGYQHGHHPVPLPGMQIVPSGYTTFQHNALYGQERWERGERARGGPGQREPAHAGIAHGESMQRLPLPMGMTQMITTVSSTVSVGPSGGRNGR
ncbi:hypothetical protein LXA43DRAFT_951657 [Ganoderma leucocontextum]|nr:hypothetical protein LXA43DRAFT_951657 [Ganoderma leucocontextum]